MSNPVTSHSNTPSPVRDSTPVTPRRSDRLAAQAANEVLSTPPRATRPRECPAAPIRRVRPRVDQISQERIYEMNRGISVITQHERIRRRIKEILDPWGALKDKCRNNRK